MKDICELCSLCSPNMGCAKLENESCLKEAIKLIKPSVTNGEVLMKMFPNMEVETDELLIEVRYLDSNNSNDIMQFYPDWWNAKWGE